jgi:hypothetical protein
VPGTIQNIIGLVCVITLNPGKETLLSLHFKE